MMSRAVTGQIDVRTGRAHPPYPDSGVKWLEEMPGHWEVRRLKTICDMRSGDTITAMSIEEDGDYPVYGGNGLRGYASAYTHDGDYVLVGRQGALCGNIHLAHGRFWASEHAVVATLDKGHVLHWFGALLNVMNLNQYSIAAAQPGLAVDRVLNLWAPVPPAGEQAAIARFLDHADGRIWRYIRAKQHLIELLEEERQAIIHQAVTGQVDIRTGQPYPAYKDSGVEWLGKVPEHWEVRRLGNVADLRVSNVDKHKRRNERPVRLCNYVDVYKNDSIHDGLQYMRATATDAEITKFQLVVGDVVVTKDSEDWTDIGVPALVEETTEDLVCGYHLAILRPEEASLHGPYLARVLRIAPVAWRFRVAAGGVTRYGLTRDSIRSVEIPLPTLPEQRVIAGSIDSTANRLDAAIAATKRQIALIGEYRTRLITDVVTGKLDFRDAAAELPSEDDLASDRDRIPAASDIAGEGTRP